MAKHITTVGAGQRISYSGPDTQPVTERILDDVHVRVKEGGDAFQAAVLEQVKQCREIVARAQGQHIEPDSIQDFARRILDEHELATAQLARGEAHEAARSAVQLGSLIATASITLKWGPDILKIIARRDSPHGGKPVDPEIAARNREMAEKFKAKLLTARCSQTALKVAIGSDYGLHRSQAIAAINAGLKNLSG